MRASGCSGASRASSAVTNPSPDEGGVSRPSSRACNRTRPTPRRAASSTRARMWWSCAWTPPGPTSPTTWSGSPVALARSQAATSARPIEERAVGDRGVDPRQVLQDGPAGSQVQMSDLGVAHLADRQPDGILGGAQDAVRPVGQQGAPGRHGRRGDRITRRVVPDPEAVEHHEHDGTRAPRVGHRVVRPGRQDARPRAWAVMPARATIPAISSGLRDAPPTRAPSIAGSARNSPMFALVTLPP